MYSGTSLNSSVIVYYYGSGSTAFFDFGIYTLSDYATKYLNIGCYVSGTLIYSRNTIAFTVNRDFIGINSTDSYNYTFN